jgi:hypothetical protein
VNTAQAFDDGPPRRVSNQARAAVRLTGGVFTDRGIIVGKVFVDENRNRIQDPGELGVIEEVPANGTSGPYFFGIANGIVNSEVVQIITRDRNHPALVLDTVQLTRFADYEFEPFTGRLLLKAPAPSLDANLNPVSIRITYEVDQGGDKFWVNGGDAQVKVTKWWEVGGAIVRDENPQANYGLYSANTTIKLANKTYLIGEVAQSDAVGTLGDAQRVELRHSSDKTDLRAYYTRADNTFSNSAAMLAAGRVEAGLKFSQKLDQRTRLVGQAIQTESLVNNGKLFGAQLGIEHTFENQVKLELGGRYAKETADPANASSSHPPGTTPNEVRALGIKLISPIPKLKNATAFVQYEWDVVESDQRLVAVGGEARILPKTRLYGRYEFINSLNAPFQLNGFQQQNTGVPGLETEYMKDGKSFNEYRMRDAITGRESEAATGLRNVWSIAEGVRASTSFERVTPVAGNLETEATAITGGIEYTRNPDWKATARLELRASTANDSLLNTFGYARKLGRDWTFLGRSILYLVDNNGPSGGGPSGRINHPYHHLRQHEQPKPDEHRSLRFHSSLHHVPQRHQRPALDESHRARHHSSGAGRHGPGSLDLQRLPGSGSQRHRRVQRGHHAMTLMPHPCCLLRMATVARSADWLAFGAQCIAVVPSLHLVQTRQTRRNGKRDFQDCHFFGPGLAGVSHSFDFLR